MSRGGLPPTAPADPLGAPLSCSSAAGPLGCDACWPWTAASRVRGAGVTHAGCTPADTGPPARAPLAARDAGCQTARDDACKENAGRAAHRMSARRSSHPLYSPLEALAFMVEKSMGCLMTEK